MVTNGVILSNRYLILHEIGSGGMGAVYEATDLRTGAQVAVKVLHPLYARNPQWISRLRREAQTAASIRNPRVVRMVDLDEHEGISYLVMEYVAGENLSDKLQREGALSPAEALAIGIEITRGLEGAHAAGVLHRDLKPSNVKITEEGEIKVLDFGIARSQDLPGITGTNAFTGTPEYCAPERIEGEGDIRADIYSLGVMLYELLAGRLPFIAPTVFAILRKHELESPPPLPFPVLPALQTVLDRTLAKDPADRFQTPSELMTALRAARDAVIGVGAGPTPGTRPHQFVPPTVVDPVTKPRRDDTPDTAVAPGVRTVTRAPGAAGPTIPDRAGGLNRRLALAGGGVLVALVVAGGAWAATRDGGGTPTPTATQSGQQGTNLTPSPSSTPTITPTVTSVPTRTSTTPPKPQILFGPGDNLLLNKEDSADVEAPAGTCQGAAKIILKDVLIITVVQRDARETGRVTVSYVRRIPRQTGIQCTGLAYLPDKDNAVLEVTRPGGDVYRSNNVGGTGLAVALVEDIYAKEASGSWLFEGIDLDITQLDLVQIKRGARNDIINPDNEMHRIRLLPR
jgi:hypothetical protein